MMLEIRRGLALAGFISLGFVISAGPGLVARAAEPDRWLTALGADASTAAPDEAAKRRIAELEQRIKELESNAQQVSTKASELTGIIARNEELTARNRALSLVNQDLMQNRAFEQPAAASDARPPTNDADPRAHLRYWAKQLRDGEATARIMSPEWKAAVNVFLRGERRLDPQNPWR